MRTQRLTPDDVATALDALPGWTGNVDVIQKTYRFPGFVEAVAFVNRVAEIAQAADHHPDIDIRFAKVTLRLTTHDSGGVTANDVALAHSADAVEAK
jgi:4a-hydroxytetrahydrobiopterin dehydratase